MVQLLVFISNSVLLFSSTICNIPVLDTPQNMEE